LWANIRPHKGAKSKIKNRGLGLKTNKNKSTQVGLNILGLDIGPENRVFQYGAFLTLYIKYQFISYLL
jgi:hypothetical protein